MKVLFFISLFAIAFSAQAQTNDAPYPRTLKRIEIDTILERSINRFRRLVTSAEGYKYSKMCGREDSWKKTSACQTDDAQQIWTTLVAMEMCEEYRAKLKQLPGDKPWDNVSDTDFILGARILYECQKLSRM